MIPETDRVAEPAPVTGTVTRLARQSRGPDRVSVFLDGRFAFGLAADVVVSLGLEEGSVVDEAEYTRIQRADGQFEARQTALTLLSRRPMSEAELHRKLLVKAFDPEVADRVVVRLRELGYLNDAEYASTYATSRSRARGYGPRRILLELRRRGIPEDLARNAVETLKAESDSAGLALEAARRAWPRYARETDRRKRTARLYGFLARRGFDHDTILAAVAELDGAV